MSQYPSRRKMKRAFREGKGRYEDGQSSFSIRCKEARERGRLPMTDAIREVRRIAMIEGQRITVAQAKTALIDTHDGEWHHVSKYGNRVNYYDPLAALNKLAGGMSL